MQPDTVLHALTDKYAELLGQARDNEERAASIREDIAHMEHVMRLYREDWTGEGVKPRRPSYPSRYLRVGQGVQTALDVLREAARPMTVREVVFGIMDRLEIAREPKAIKSLESSVRFCLAKRVGHELVEVGRDPIRFTVAPEPLGFARLKAKLKRADVGYAELARRLAEAGLPETEGSVTVKINRGAFPAWFLFASLHAIGCHVLRVGESG